MSLPLPSEEAVIACAKRASELFGIPYPASVVTLEQADGSGDFLVRHVRLPAADATLRSTRVLEDIETFTCHTPGSAYFRANAYLNAIGGEMPLLLRRHRYEDQGGKLCWAVINPHSRRVVWKGDQAALASFRPC